MSIIEVLLRKSKYYCLAPFERSFGNPAEDIFFGLRVASMKGKKLVIIARKQTFIRKFISRFLRDRMSNKEIFDLECPGLIVPHRDLEGYDFFARLLDTFYLFFAIIRALFFKVTRFDLFNASKFPGGYIFEMPRFGQKTVFIPNGRKTFSSESDKTYQWSKSLFEKYPIQFEEKKEKAAQELRLKMGLPLDAEYVCLHVRETSFHAEKNEISGFRCSDILNYGKAIDYLMSQGLWVVRIGDPRMKPAPFKNERFIDYPFSNFKSELLDLYFIKNCKLFIGTDSGPYDVARLFQRDTIFVNITGWSQAFPLNHGDLGLTKYFYSKSRQRFLSVKEILEEPYTINHHLQTPGDTTDYKIYQNTAEDIEAIVKEKLGQNSNYAYSDLQNECIAKRRAQCKDWLEKDPHFKNNPYESYKLASRVPYKGTLGKEFLRNNWEYGEHLEKMTRDFKKAGLDKQ